MHLTEQQITKYQQIYQATFGVAISKEEALVQGLALVCLVKAIATQPSMKTKENENEDKQPRSTVQ